MTKITIDFVSDVSCPYCLAGLLALDIALERMGDTIEPELRFHPYELNPSMPPAGERLAANLGRKFGMSAADIRSGCAAMTQRVSAMGFSMTYSDTSGIYNTHDAHRLLTWAAGEGRQPELKRALFAAYFSKGQSPSDHGVLIEAAQIAGLDADAAQAILSSDQYGEQVRIDEAVWRQRGVQGVPYVLIDGEHAISGSQSPEYYQEMLQRISGVSRL